MSLYDNAEIEISKERIKCIGIILLAAVILFAVIGWLTSPQDENGKPVLLLPEVKAFEDYRRSARSWLEQMTLLDSEIAGVLGEQVSGDLFTRSRQAQQMLQRAVNLANEIDQAKVPAAAAGIHDQISATGLFYLDVARLTMRWVGAPEEPTRESINEKLEQSRNGRSALQENQWMRTP
ncbi:hypothetical protein LARV_00924 [Longilinea arvoryzae]|uniref:Uncharacterized protein n=2 Tax=Longilinea arvoryzae TaxID=360412 RepID=A0A0S7BHF3_9CHLR|nr:hypothetical protein LARV_00924 [Longilinea arvoryzae]